MAVEACKRKDEESHLMFDRAPKQGFSIKTPSGDDIRITIDRISVGSKNRAHISIWAKRDIIIERDDLKK